MSSMKVQFITSILFLMLFTKKNMAYSQSVNLNTGSREYQLLDRLDIKNVDSGKLDLPTSKPVLRKSVTEYVEWLNSAITQKKYKENYDLSPVDLYNMDKLMMDNSEWLSKPTNSYNSKKPIWNSFYKTKNNLYEVKTNDFHLVVNPQIQQIQSYEIDNKKRVYLNSKGVELRASVGKKVGIYASLTDNQENGPKYYSSWVDSFEAVQGEGFYKKFKINKGQDYFDYRGYITVNTGKYINVQYGYDKNFIGNGYRSLFLSDFSSPTLFLKLNTKVWKLNYQNLFMELTPTFSTANGGSVLEKKYAAMHHLGIKLSESFNIGLFESVIFNRRKYFEFGYLVPVIFYRAVESGLGSGDNALIGSDFKINFDQHFQLYGQLLIDEFVLKGLKTKSWTNKFGGQLGLKYIDVANIPNLDLQLEWNIVRPYTYSHFDSASSYTNYNQPLAHPLGANFSELIAIVRYQPKPKLYFESRLFLSKQGLDSSLNSVVNFGGNIFRTYNNRFGDVDQTIGQGVLTKTVNFNLLGSYEFKTNFYLESSVQFRYLRKPTSRQINSVISLGFRWNLNRREHDF